MFKCSCGVIHNRKNQRKCLDCHNKYMRNWRKTHRLDGISRLKMNCRSYANVYQRRGDLIPQPCEVKGCKEETQKHHDDYSKPLEVRWLCRKHHLELHQQEQLQRSGI